MNYLFIIFIQHLKSTRKQKIPENVISGNCSVNQKSKYRDCLKRFEIVYDSSALSLLNCKYVK